MSNQSEKNYRKNLNFDLQTIFGKEFELPVNFSFSEKETENGKSSLIIETIYLTGDQLNYFKNIIAYDDNEETKDTLYLSQHQK